MSRIKYAYEKWIKDQMIKELLDFRYWLLASSHIFGQKLMANG